MRKVREVLRLSWVCGLSQRQVASSCGLGRSTVGEYLERAASAGVVDWPSAEALGDEVLERRRRKNETEIFAKARKRRRKAA